LVYGASQQQAIAQVKALALRAIAYTILYGDR
jgi:hypothetical protein